MKNEHVVPSNLIKVVFESEHIPALFGGVQAHDPAVRLSAQLVRHTQDDGLIESVVAAALPADYGGDTLKELPGMIAGARNKGFDVDEPAHGNRRKGKNGGKDPRPSLMELFDQSGAALFHDASGKGFVGLPLESGGVTNVRVRSDTTRRYLRSLVYRSYKQAIPARDLDTFIETLEARAQFDSEQCETAIRVGGDTTRVYHDLGRPDGAVIEVTADGATTTLQPALKMIRVDGMQALPFPASRRAATSGLNAFKALLRLEGDTWNMILAFIIGAFRPKGPFACLSIQGEQGAGKSLICELIKEIVDPAVTSRLSMPDDERNLFIIAMHHFLIVFDNLSGLKRDISDALCKLATGGGFSIRSLYTDDQLVTFSVTRPFAMNGISDFVHRADLMDRTIPVHLKSMPEGARRSEEEIRKEFAAILPDILTDIYAAVSCAIRNLPATPVPTVLRMADAAQWLTAAEPALGLDEGTFVRTLKGQQDEAMVDLATGDTIHTELLSILSSGGCRGVFEGSASELLAALRGQDKIADRFFPTTPAQLSAKLNRLRTSLEKVGVIVELLPRSHAGRRVRVTLSPELHAQLAPTFEPRF